MWIVVALLGALLITGAWAIVWAQSQLRDTGDGSRSREQSKQRKAARQSEERLVAAWQSIASRAPHSVAWMSDDPELNRCLHAGQVSEVHAYLEARLAQPRANGSGPSAGAHGDGTQRRNRDAADDEAWALAAVCWGEGHWRAAQRLRQGHAHATPSSMHESPAQTQTPGDQARWLRWEALDALCEYHRIWCERLGLPDVSESPPDRVRAPNELLSGTELLLLRMERQGRVDGRHADVWLQSIGQELASDDIHELLTSYRREMLALWQKTVDRLQMVPDLAELQYAAARLAVKLGVGSAAVAALRDSATQLVGTPLGLAAARDLAILRGELPAVGPARRVRQLRVLA